MVFIRSKFLKPHVVWASLNILWLLWSGWHFSCPIPTRSIVAVQYFVFARDHFFRRLLYYLPEQMSYDRFKHCVKQQGVNYSKRTTINAVVCYASHLRTKRIADRKNWPFFLTQHWLVDFLFTFANPWFAVPTCRNTYTRTCDNNIIISTWILLSSSFCRKYNKGTMQTWNSIKHNNYVSVIGYPLSDDNLYTVWNMLFMRFNHFRSRYSFNIVQRPSRPAAVINNNG